MEIKMKRIIMPLLLVAMLFTVSCNKKYIKNTEIEETPDSKRILYIFAHYVKGFKDKDPTIFQKYISKEYYDNNGTDDAKDDVDYEKLMAILNSEQFNALKKVEIIYIIKDLDIDEATKTAKLLFFYEVRFKRKSKLETEEDHAFVKDDGMTNHKLNDNNQMELKKEEDGQWRIISGL